MKRISVSLVLSFLIVLLAHIPSFAADKMQIAVLDLQPKGVSKLVAGAASDIIRSEMVKTGLFTVVERGQMNEILKEQGFQQTGCTDQACAVQLGKLLSAKKILIGEVTKVGNSIIITVRIVDVEKGTSEFAANEKAGNEDMLDKAGENITRKLAQNIVEGNPEYSVQRKTVSGYYARSIVPGWGQFYADQDTKGYVFMGAFVATVGYTLYSYFNFTKAEKDYNDLQRGTSESEFNSKFDEKKSAGQMVFIAGGITAAVYIAHWADAIFFSKKEFDKQQASSGGAYPDYALMVNGGRYINGDKTISVGTVWRF